MIGLMIICILTLVPGHYVVVEYTYGFTVTTLVWYAGSSNLWVQWIISTDNGVVARINLQSMFVGFEQLVSLISGQSHSFLATVSLKTMFWPWQGW